MRRLEHDFEDVVVGVEVLDGDEPADVGEGCLGADEEVLRAWGKEEVSAAVARPQHRRCRRL